MRLTSNFVEMPILLKLVVVVSLLAPVIVILSVLTGSVVPMSEQKTNFGNASSLSELTLVVLSALPISLSAYMMLLKRRWAKLIFPGAWVFICFSPLFLFSVRSQLELFLLEASFNVFLGIIISAYLFFSRDARRYLR